MMIFLFVSKWVLIKSFLSPGTWLFFDQLPTQEVSKWIRNPLKVRKILFFKRLAGADTIIN